MPAQAMPRLQAHIFLEDLEGDDDDDGGDGSPLPLREVLVLVFLEEEEDAEGLVPSLVGVRVCVGVGVGKDCGLVGRSSPAPALPIPPEICLDDMVYYCCFAIDCIEYHRKLNEIEWHDRKKSNNPSIQFPKKSHEVPP